MAAVLNGAAVFWGISSTFVCSGSAIGGTGATLNPQSTEFEKSSDKSEVPNYYGQTIAEQRFNKKQTLKLEVIPTADTIAHAKSASIIPDSGAVVEIVDTDNTQIAGSASANNAWIVDTATQSAANKNAIKLTFNLYRFADADLADVAT